MHAFLTIVLLAATLLATSCTKSQSVTFQPGGTLSAAEQQSLSRLHQGFAIWQPEFSAIWGQGENSHHVCLHSPWGSIKYPYSVFVFDTSGRVIEANVIEAASGSQPLILLGVSPLQVVFTGGGTNGLFYSHEAGLRRAVEYGGEIQQLQESTNRTQPK